MADVSIDSSISTSTARGLRTVVFTTPLIGYWHFIDSDGRIAIYKTTDGGASWAVLGFIPVVTTNIALDVWYDKWTPGDTGTRIHLVHFDSTNDQIIYRWRDTSDDSSGGGTIAFAGASAVAGRGAFCSITKTRSGYLYVAFDIDAGAEKGLVRSTDGGANWSANLSTTFVGATLDQCLLFPATGSGDNNDMVSIMLVAGSDRFDFKGWDSSAAAATSSSNITGHIDNTTDLTGQMGFSATVRHSDGNIILINARERDTATADIEVWDIAGWIGSGWTQKTNITTNIDDIYYPAVFIDQNTDAIYVAYNGKRDGSEVLGTTTKIYYTKSTDGGTTWTSGDTDYQEGATAAAFQVWAPISGPLFYVSWRVGTTLVGNKVNSVNVAPSTSRTATDAPTTSESIATVRNLVRAATESLTTSSPASRIGNFLRTLTDAPTTSESISSSKTKVRTCTDNPSIIEHRGTRLTGAGTTAINGPYYNLGLFNGKTLYQNLINDKYIAWDSGDNRWKVCDDVSFATVWYQSDAANYTYPWQAASWTPVSGSAPPPVVEQFVNTAKGQTRTATDAPTIAEVGSRTVSTSRTATDALTTAEAVTASKSFNRTATDALTISEAATRAKVTARSATDAPTTAEVATRSVLLSRGVTDAPTTSDAVARLLSAVRATTEALSVSMTVARILAVLRAITDALTTSETASRILAAVRAATDSPTISEVASRTIIPGGTAVNRTATDALSTAEAATRLFVGTRSATDAPTTAEAATKIAAHPRTATDAIATAEVASRILVAQRTTTDSLSVSMTAVRTVTFLRSATDALSVAMTVARNLVVARSAVDALGTTESASRLLQLVRTTSDVASTSELAVATRNGVSLSRTATDTLNVSMTVSRLFVGSRTTTDAPTIAEAAAKFASHPRTTTDALVISEVATAVRGAQSLNRTTTDALLISEVAIAVRIQSLARTTTETLVVLEVAGRILVAHRSALDHPVISESAIAIATGEDQFEYNLDLDTGNDPVNAEHECNMAESELVGAGVADTDLLDQPGDSSLSYTL